MSPTEREPRARTWREVLRDVLVWLAIGLFVLTLPLSFPALVVYKKVRKQRLAGKGAAFLFLLWIGMTVLWIVIGALADLYARKGFSGLEKALWILLGWVLWTLIVIGSMRILIEVIGGIARIRRWWTSRRRQ